MFSVEMRALDMKYTRETANWLAEGMRVLGSFKLIFFLNSFKLIKFVAALFDCRTVLGGEQQQQYRCELCGRLFKNLQALNGHMRLHGGYLSKKVSDPFLRRISPAARLTACNFTN